MYHVFKKTYDLTVKEKLMESLKEYKKIIQENNGLCVIIDARNIELVSPKLAWESASEIIKFNDIAKKHIRASSILLRNRTIINLVKVITKIHPFITPTKVCQTNEEAMGFINNIISTNK